MKTWYVVRNEKQSAVADIQIIDFIGDWMDDTINRVLGESIGTTARAFVEDLAKLPDAVKTIRVHINSPGGDVQGAINIANALREQAAKGRRVETIVDGLAASAATIVMMAGQKVSLADNALVMVHNPWMISVGNAEDLRQAADVLDTIRGQIIATYQWHSPLSAAALGKLMDAETWMDADEAIAHGFATAKVKGLKAAASINSQALAKLTIPEQYRERVSALARRQDPPAPTPAPAPPAPARTAAAAIDVMRACEAARCPDLALALVAEGASMETVQARVLDEQQRRTAAAAREAEIGAACAIANMPALAGDYVRGGMSPAAAARQLVTIKALLDQVEIDNKLTPPAMFGEAAPRTPPPNHAEIYTARAQDHRR